MSVSFEIELSDLSEDAVRRLLKESWRQQALNSMPQSKRKKAKEEMEDEGEDEDEEEDEGYCEACKENDAKVAMNRGESMPSLPSVRSDDLPKGVKVPRPKKEKKKNG